MIDYVNYFELTISLAIALLLDKLLGEPKSFHPLVGFGLCASWLEGKLNKYHSRKLSTRVCMNYMLGALSCGLLIVPVVSLYYASALLVTGSQMIVLDGVLIYLAIGLKSLRQHAMQVYHPLLAQDISQARHFTAYLVSRNTSELTPQQMARATTESMLENGNDAVIASLVCYGIGGIPLVIVHRLVNTLDAMWGYRNERFSSFGYCVAKLDDVLGFVGAKITALLYAIQGDFTLSLRNAYYQGKAYKSLNGGWAMASGATALNIRVGGKAKYDGISTESVTLGSGHVVGIFDIERSVKLVERAAIIFTLVVACYQVLCFLLVGV